MQRYLDLRPSAHGEASGPPFFSFGLEPGSLIWKRPVVWPADHRFFLLTRNLAALSGSIPWCGDSHTHVLHLGRTWRIKRLREILQVDTSSYQIPSPLY